MKTPLARAACLASALTGTLAWAMISAPQARAAAHYEEVSVSKAATSEQRDRDVDQVAVSAQELAISRLQALLNKYRNTSQEPVFLVKLAEIQQQKAAIQFRIAHGAASGGKKAVDLSSHDRTTRQAIAQLDRLISRYPGYEEIAHAYFLRGKSFEELGEKPKAAEDYLHLVKNFPNSDESATAYMSLAEFSIDASDHPAAIAYLKEVEKRPEDPHYPFALYKLAWSYYNLKRIPEALSYAERQIAYYADRARRAETDYGSASDAALRENTLLDVTVFFFEGYEEDLKPYALDRALDYFKGLASRSARGDEAVLGRMCLRFGKLLRSHSHDADLVSWKNQVLASQSRFPESLDLVLLVYEYELNHRRYGLVVDCAHDLVSLYGRHKEYESFPKAQKQVLDTAEGLQALIVKNKGATEVGSYSRVLAQIYDSFVHMVEESDPRIPRAHFNLAETLFTVRDFPGATSHYRWVVEHGRWDTQEEAALAASASLGAISARYEWLRLKDLVPRELAPRAFPPEDSSEIDGLLAEWIQWLDARTERSREGTENFLFEANRSLYAHGQLRRATRRMTDFSTKNPTSAYAVPQASLVLDTLIASQDWRKTRDTARDFMAVKEWKKGPFAARLLAVASDASYKMIEAEFRARQYESVLGDCEEFLRQYAQSARLGDVLALAGSAALEQIDRKRAESYFSRLIRDVPGNSNVPVALLARAAIEEDHYRFREAASDNREYVARARTQAGADAKKLDALREKALMLTWLAGDRASLQAALSDPVLCPASLAADCERFGILLRIAARPSQPSQPPRADSLDSKTANRGLWAILALEDATHLSFRDRNLAIELVARDWERLDPLVKFALLPRVSRSVPAAFRLNRLRLDEVAPLKADPKWIARRVDSIREMENAATAVMKMPWARLRAETLNEMAGVYLDLARGLAAITTEDVRQITIPFEEKGQDMRAKAFEIASRSAIEDASFSAISEPFFAENPTQAKAIKSHSIQAAAPRALGLEWLAGLDPHGGWPELISRPGDPVPEDLAYDNPALYVKSLWARAVQSGNLPQVAFFMQEAQEKALVQAGIMSLVKAASLALVGARGEALGELDDGRRDLAPEARARVSALLGICYGRSLAYEKAAKFAVPGIAYAAVPAP